MDEQPKAGVGVVVGAIVAVAAIAFVVTGGIGGKKTIEGDHDLPPIASGTAPGK
jgi:hypothetical protein